MVRGNTFTLCLRLLLVHRPTYRAAIAYRPPNYAKPEKGLWVAKTNKPATAPLLTRNSASLKH